MEYFSNVKILFHFNWRLPSWSKLRWATWTSCSTTPESFTADLSFITQEIRCKGSFRSTSLVSKNTYFLLNTELQRNYWDMVNCSNCDCSKNLLDTILLLLDTIWAIIFFLVICSNPVDLWGWTGFEQFNF